MSKMEINYKLGDAVWFAVTFGTGEADSAMACVITRKAIIESIATFREALGGVERSQVGLRTVNEGIRVLLPFSCIGRTEEEALRGLLKEAITEVETIRERLSKKMAEPQED